MADRFKELQNKGWVNLSKDEREEYKALKDSAGGAQSTQSTYASTPNGNPIFSDGAKELAKTKKEETLTLSKAQLDDLIKAKVTEAMGVKTIGREGQPEKWEPYVPPKKPNKTATFRLWRETSDEPYGLIIDWQFHKNIFNEETRKNDMPEYKIKLLYPDGSTVEKKMTWLDFAHITEIERVEIIEENRQKMAMKKGKIRVPIKNNEGYYLSQGLDGSTIVGKASSRAVDDVVIKDEVMVKVRRENGQTFSINANRLNG